MRTDGESYLVAKIAGCWWFALCLVEIGEAPKLDLWFLPGRSAQVGTQVAGGQLRQAWILVPSMISNSSSHTLLVTLRGEFHIYVCAKCACCVDSCR